MAENIRRDNRVDMDAEIRFHYPEKISGKMKDFCTGGMGAELPVTIDIDSPVEVEIFGGRLLATGFVRWVDIAEGTVRVGIQFREEDREVIRQVSDWTGTIQ